MKIKYINGLMNKCKRRIFNPVARNVYWRIDRKKRLILFGRGRIPGYAPGTEYFDPPPWHMRRFHQVVIGEGITDIHPTALLGVDLDRVILKNEYGRGDGLEITEAGLYNHFKKTLLIGRDQEHVKIADGTEYINPFAFAFCQNVKTIECPPSLKKIGVSAFEGCKKLRYIYRLPANAVFCLRALKGTSGVRVYRDESPVQRAIYEMHPKNALTNYGRGHLMNGEFLFFASEGEKNIDPTRFYNCTDLKHIMGGDDFLLGLRSDGTVLLEELNPFSGVFDYYGEPFQFEETTGFERLTGWENISEIAVAGKIAAGVDKDGRVFCTASENEDLPVKGLTDAFSLEVKDGKIFALRENWCPVLIAGGESYV